jgi:hypothetical protein
LLALKKKQVKRFDKFTKQKYSVVVDVVAHACYLSIGEVDVGQS